MPLRFVGNKTQIQNVETFHQTKHGCRVVEGRCLSYRFLVFFVFRLKYSKQFLDVTKKDNDLRSHIDLVNKYCAI